MQQGIKFRDDFYLQSFNFVICYKRHKIKYPLIAKAKGRYM